MKTLSQIAISDLFLRFVQDMYQFLKKKTVITDSAYESFVWGANMSNIIRRAIKSIMECLRKVKISLNSHPSHDYNTM